MILLEIVLFMSVSVTPFIVVTTVDLRPTENRQRFDYVVHRMNPGVSVSLVLLPSLDVSYNYLLVYPHGECPSFIYYLLLKKCAVRYSVLVHV